MVAGSFCSGKSPRFEGVRTVAAEHITSHEQFLALLDGSDEPILLRGAACARDATSFNVRALSEEFSDLRLPDKALVVKQGARSGANIFVAEQDSSEAVLGAAPSGWNPGGCSFGSFLQGLSAGSGRYLTTRSGEGACRRSGEALVYDAPARIAGEEDSAVSEDVLIQALVPRVPMPLLLPQDRACRMVFWMGARGNNFGLHTDLFSEQFLVQHEGTKEVLILLPEDASIVAPFPFLSSPIWYKSEKRRVSNLELGGETCLRAELRPGDVLYIPLWWWHEVRTISEGASVSTTYRFATEDGDRFNKVMNAVYQFHRRAQDRPCGRLARHLRSYLVYGLARAEQEAAGAEQQARRGAWPWQPPFRGPAPPPGGATHGVLLGLAAGLAAASALGFALGRRVEASRRAGG